MNAPASPTVQAWELALRLREHREALGLTAAGVGNTIGMAQGYVSGVEAGKVKLPEHRLAQLVEVYGLDGNEAARLEELRVGANERGWWQDYAQLLSPAFIRFLGFESGAARLQTYDGEALHGLLQTEEYARAVIRGGSPHVRLTEVDRRVASRMSRQTRLEGRNPLRLTAVIGQGALLQQVGGLDVMRRQLNHLVKTMDDKADHVEIRVMPFTSGAHPAFGGPFQILSFESPILPDLVWQENVTLADIVDQQVRVTEYVMTFAETLEKALDVDDSRKLIRKIAREMT